MRKVIKLLLEKQINLSQYNIFVETGLYHGETIKELKHYGMMQKFEKIYSIEIQEEFIHNFWRRNEKKDYSNLILINGDSSTQIKKLIEKHIDSKFIFWLDGHYSAGDTGISEISGECPLIYELNQILELNKIPIIIIDDVDYLFVPPMKDWPTIHLVIDNLLKINPNYLIDIKMTDLSEETKEEITNKYTNVTFIEESYQCCMIAYNKQ